METSAAKGGLEHQLEGIVGTEKGDCILFQDMYHGAQKFG